MTRNHIVLLTRCCAVVAAGSVFALASQVAVAAPTNVTVRVEGRTGTVFEGLVTTDAKQITKGSSTYLCQGSAGSPSGTLTTALDDASLKDGFAWTATFSDDFFIDQIASDANNFAANESWFYWNNHKLASVGGCQVPVKPGDEVLYAITKYDSMTYDPGPTLGLEVSPKAQTGEPVIAKVLAYDKNGVGTPAAGVTVSGAGKSALTGLDGKVALSFPNQGAAVLKAGKAGFVRSNGASTCIYIAGSGACDTVRASSPAVSTQSQVQVDKTAAKGQILWPNRNRYRRSGPKLLRGVAPADPSGIAAVKIKLLQRSGGKRACRGYNFKHERFTARCGKAGFKKIASGAANTDLPWSYQLRKPLPPGRYELDLKVKDGAGNVDTFEYRRSRRIFRVVAG